MTDAQMYRRFSASDPDFNGRFFTGVLTTGIYCLPSCKARKPKQENVRFFPSCEAAREAGFRACRKCHPDDFARGADPVLETIETLVEEARLHPERFADARAIVRRSGFGSTRAFELLRQHYQLTPHDLLISARVAAGKRLLVGTRLPLVDVALGVGFESVSVFHDQFRRLNGLTPGAYRDLRTSSSFEVALPDAYPLAYLKRALGRDTQSLAEHLEGDVFRTAVRLQGKPAVLTVRLEAAHVGCSVTGGSALDAHPVLVGMLGLEQNAGAFSRLARKLGLARLVEGREGLRIVQTPGVYDGLLWAIIGQQINLPFAFTLRRRLMERVSERLEEKLYAPPTPEAVARLTPEELAPLQFSRKKAEYLIHISRQLAGGAIEQDRLRAMSATRLQRVLLAEPGLGAWSVNYVMMRSLGFADCVPLGDTGVTSGLKALFRLDERPDADATRRLMAVFSPFRSLATAHLWQFNRPAP